MAAPLRALLLCLLVVSAHAFELPSQQRQKERHERRYLERHGLLSTARPPLPRVTQSGTLDRGATQPGTLDRGATVSSRHAVDTQPELEPEPEQRPEPEPEPEPEQRPQPQPEPEPDQQPEAEQELKLEPVAEPEPTPLSAAPGEKQGVEGEAAPAGPSSRQMAPQTQQVDQPNVISSDQASNIGVEETTVTPELVTYEPVPDKSYAVFDHHGRICILAMLSADLEIIYYTEYDERKKYKVRLPDDADVTGACARDDAKPLISFRWDDFEFSMFFTENDIGNTWYVSEMKLEYDASQLPEVKPPTVAGRQQLWMDQQMQHTLHLFGTPVDKAYYCTSKQDLDLYNGDGVRSATVILWDLHLQPYVRNGQFGASVNCPGVPVGRRRINEAVPLAVGSTLAAVAVLTIAGYAVWRHFKVKKFNYDTME